MGLLITNGEIVTAGGRSRADIYCEDETITLIGRDLAAEVLAKAPDTEVVDASGKYVFPGFIDPHVHIYLPFMGTATKDTHATGSQAALVGGTTTYIEMLAPSRNEDLREGYAHWRQLAEGNSACDYTFHIGVTRFDDKTEGVLRDLVADGMTSFKVFLAYAGFFGVTDEELYATLRLAKELGVRVTAHCENSGVIAAMQETLLANGQTGPEWHEPSRPVAVEAAGTTKFATFLEMTGAKGYVVHLSNERALKAAVEAKMRGVDLSIEAVIPHLVLDRTYAERENFEGAKYVMSPPLRTRNDQRALWRGLVGGLIDTVGTDHAPFDVEQKAMGKDAFPKIPNGMPAIEDRVNLLYTYGVSRGQLSLERFVEVASTNAAKLFDLYPQKGTIAVGADADLVIYDPGYRGSISAETHKMNVDYSAFEGFEIDGRPSVVTVRGRVAVRDGEFVGEAGRGRLLRRKVA